MVGLVRDVYKGRVASTRPFEQPPEVEAPPKPAKEPPKEVSDENTTEVKKTRRGRKPKSSELVPEKLPEPLTPVTPKVANVDEVPIPKWANMEDIFGFSDE